MAAKGKLSQKLQDKNVYGPEPKNEVITNDTQFTRTLNWYNYMRKWKDSQKYAEDYFKTRDEVRYKKIQGSNYPETVIGWVCRMLTRGTVIEHLDIEDFFKRKVDTLPDPVEVIETKEDEVVALSPSKLEPFDPIAVIEDEFDLMFSEGSEFEPRKFYLDNNLGPVILNKIIRKYTEVKEEYELARSGKDPQLKEAYSHHSDEAFEILIDFLDDVINDANDIIEVNKQLKRKKKKPVPLSKRVKGVKYLVTAKIDKLSLSSLEPEQLIDATQIYLYNVKTRKVSVYNSDGFDIKGTTLLNIKTSGVKTVRKPFDFLSQFKNMKKRDCGKIYKDLTSKENDGNGRINKDTLILKIFK